MRIFRQVFYGIYSAGVACFSSLQAFVVFVPPPPLTLQSRGSPKAALLVPSALRAPAPPHFHVRPHRDCYPMNRLLAYHPPKSVSHGHGSKARNALKAWSATQDFLTHHVLAELSPHLKLTVWGENQWNDNAVTEATVQEASAAFGPSSNVSGIFHNWELPASMLDTALEFAFADSERPKQTLGPVSLHFSYSLTWKALPTPSPRSSGQLFQRGCCLGVSIGGRKVFFNRLFCSARHRKIRNS